MSNNDSVSDAVKKLMPKEDASAQRAVPTIIDPRTVMVAVPTHSSRIDAETMGGLISSFGLFGFFFPVQGVSHVSLARNVIADAFLQHENFEWLVCIDDDICFKRDDLQILLQPFDSEKDYSAPGEARPTRIPLELSQLGKPLDDKVNGIADALVCAQYRYKQDDYNVVNFGMGFVRIHRSVFRTLEKLEHEPNRAYRELKEVLHDLELLAQDANDAKMPQLASRAEAAMVCIERSLPDPGGGPRLWQATHKGRLFYDYFPSGPILSQFIPTAEWKGEDHGFFTLCHLAGIIPRIETRTRLGHAGRKIFEYEGPEGGGGQ